jgi:two-component system sensor histidine kinase KdpD
VLFGSVVNELVRKSGDVGDYVITEARGGAIRPTSPGPGHELVGLRRGHRRGGSLDDHGLARVPTLRAVEPDHAVPPGRGAVATRPGPSPSIFASVLSVAAFDFFFMPPYLTFVVSDGQYL